MNKLILSSLFFSTLFLFVCDNTVSTEDPSLNLVYCSVIGNSADQKDIIGSASRDNALHVVTTKNGNGLWGSNEEIGFYYLAKTVFNGTLWATFEKLTGSDTVVQGGVMIRASLKGTAAPYAALRLIKDKYDPVARLDSTLNASASGLENTFQKGDQLFIACTEKTKTGAVRNLEINVGVNRKNQPLISKKYIISTMSDSLYIGLFGADRSAAGGSFSVSNVKIE
ncbi:MAG TPA: hypothetical protein VHO70_02430 [Chitinispirillaceae bacterium]|nr:hypothetical protein [Chitinispirillaceae bacterium]